MANLPIPADMQSSKAKDDAEEKAPPRPKASEPKAKPVKRLQQPAQLQQAPVHAPPAWTDTDAFMAMQQQNMQIGYPQAQGATSSLAGCGYGTAAPTAYGAPGYGPMCAMPTDPAGIGYGQMCGGVPGDASTAVLQLQYARYAAAMQFQTAYAVGGAAMLNSVANPGQPSGATPQMQQSMQQNIFNLASGGEPPRKRMSDRGRPREPHDPERRFVGTITKWDDDAGFGFISSWDAYKVYGKDVFVHKAQIGLIGGASAMYAKRRRSEIRNGDTVSYTVDLAENPGKPRAYNVEKLAAPPEGPISGEAELAKRRKLEAERGLAP